MYPLARGYFSFFCPSVLLEKQKCQHLDVLFRTMLAHIFSIYVIYFALLSLGPFAFTTVQFQRVNPSYRSPNVRGGDTLSQPMSTAVHMEPK
jgi:hypothetical protein